MAANEGHVEGIQPRQVVYPKSDELYEALLADDIPLMRKLLEERPELISVDYEYDGKTDCTPLYIASSLGKVDIIEMLVTEFGAHLESNDSNADTSLVVAAARGQTEAVKCLLKCGADVDKTTSFQQRTALDAAAQGDHPEIVTLFLEYGADAQAASSNLGSAKTQLPQAILDQNIPRIKELLKKHPQLINVRYKDNEGAKCTALHIAARVGNVEIIKMLITEHNANPNVVNSSGATSLVEAASRGQTKVVECLLQCGANVDQPDILRQTPLYWAASKGHAKVVTLLLQDGAEVDKWNHARQTALYWAVSGGHTAVVKLLLEGGADPNREGSGSIPLHSAAIKNNKGMVELLLHHGAYINARDQNGHIPLHQAVRKDTIKIETVEVLLKNGADVNAKDQNGQTPLHQAVQSDKGEKIELLLAHGAEINAKDQNGQTPLDYAILCNKPGMVKFLLSHGAHNINATAPKKPFSFLFKGENAEKELLKAKYEETRILLNKPSINKLPSELVGRGNAALLPREQLFNAILNSYIITIQQLLREYPTLIHARYSYENDATPLHIASSLGNVKIIEMLITQYGANLKAVDSNGNTLLLAAAAKGHAGAVEYFLNLNKGANVNQTNWDGKTALYKAAMGGHEQVVALLLSYGAEPDAVLADARFLRHTPAIIKLLLEHKDRDEQTPLHRAVNGGNTKMVKILLENGADINAKDKDGRTPLDKAKNEKICVLLQEKLGQTADDGSFSPSRSTSPSLFFLVPREIDKDKKEGDTLSFRLTGRQNK